MENTVVVDKRGITFLQILFLILLIAKLGGWFQYSWWWVFAPFWIPAIIWLVVAVCFLFGFIAHYFLTRKT